MILTNTLACAIVLIFGASGVLNTLALPKARELAAETGFSVAAYRRIGVLQLAGVAGVALGPAVPALGGLAGVGLLLLLAGAVVVHLRKGHPGCQDRARRRVRRACRLIPRGPVRLKRRGSSPHLHGWAAPAGSP
ncbi:DoxX family protein [Streptomyces sp. NK15101]|uniref:DoxX family protein n=1 Tax=Streptomyces sp. NK15101 TaxID=2873261 RepID=UPI001CEDF420|nr:DoxX family protein [Streptomyces sp. NK15101]